MKNKDTELMEKGWQQMQVILDKEMPTTRRRRVGAYWWLAASLLIGSFIGLYRLRQMPTAVQQTVLTALPQDAAVSNQYNQGQQHASTQASVAGSLSAVSGREIVQVAVNQTLSKENAQPKLIVEDAQIMGQVHQSGSDQTSIAHAAEPSTLPQLADVSNESVMRVLTALTARELPDQVINQELRQLELLTKPKTIAAKKEKWQLGMGAALGSSLLPTPSSAQLNLDARYFLNSGLQLGVALGAQYTSFKGNQTVLVEVPSALLHNADVSPAVVDYLSASAAEGLYPALTKAFYYQVGASVHQRLNAFWLAGLSAQYFRLTEAQLNSTTLEASVHGNLSGFDPALQADVTKTLDSVGSQLLAKNSLAVQAQLSRQLNRNFQISLGLRAFVTKGYPDPMSVQLGCVYTPLHF